MQRRDFFRTLATAVAGFTILPPATTYGRIWKARRFVLNPEYDVKAQYEMIYDVRNFTGTWKWVYVDHPNRPLFDPTQPPAF